MKLTRFGTPFLVALFLMIVTSPVHATEPGEIPAANEPAQTSANSSDPTKGGYRTQLESQLKEIESAPWTKPKAGGPVAGDGSSRAKGVGLPAEVASLWPSPGVELTAPNRESRVSFNVLVDSRTFQGKIVEADTGEVALGVDGTPALFTRSAITATETYDVIGLYPGLAPGKYRMEWNVKTLTGKSINGVAEFTQMEPISAQGGGNHRHGAVRLPFEKELTDLARGLLIVAFALLFRKKSSPVLLPAALAVAGLIHVSAYAVTTTDTILTGPELLARLDGWAAAGVLAGAVMAALSRTNTERSISVAFSAVSALSTGYIPNLSMSAPTVVLFVSSLVAAGYWMSTVLGWKETAAVRQLAAGLVTSAAPVIAVVVNAGTLSPQRGIGEDFRMRLLAAAVILACVALSTILQRLVPAGRTRLYVTAPFILPVIAFAAMATAAPALL